MTLLAAVSSLAGCGSIGEGSTIQSLEILPAGGTAGLGPHKLYECLRDQLVVVATFSDGVRADFSFRVTWTSSNPDVVQVSNNDVPGVFIVDGEFQELAGSPYRPGTLIPKASSGTATITASFVGLSASMDVTVDPAALSIARIAPGVNPGAPPSANYVGVGTTQRFTFLAERSGKLSTLTMLNVAGSLNPVLWRFTGGEFDNAESGVANDFDKYAAPTADNPTVVINPLTGTVTGIAPDAAVYDIEAVTHLCPTTPATAPVRAVPLVPDVDGRVIILAHEENFNGQGQPFSGDLISGTSELLRVTANLDTDNDGSPDAFQDLGTQVDTTITHTTSCVEGEALCVCTGEDPDEVCLKNVLAITGLALFTSGTAQGGGGTVQACFSTVDDNNHSDDCEETEEGAPAPHLSNILAINAVPVDPAQGVFTLVAPGSTSEPALTYPGAAFEVYGSGFVPLEGFTFNGDGVQKFTRLVDWQTRTAGSTQFSDVAFVRDNSDGLFNDTGRMAYVGDVAENTGVEVSLALPAFLSAVTPLPDPVPFTVCPSAGC